MDVQDVLDNLEAWWPGWFDPNINPIETHFRVADARMTVFRSERQWVIFFERVDYHVGMDEYQVSLSAYGNCLQEEFEDGIGLNGQLLPYYRHPFEFDEEATEINPETGSWNLQRDRFCIWLDGRMLDFTPTPEDYAAAGIVFDEEPQRPDTIHPEQLLRFLCHHLDHPFFNSEDFLRSVIDVFKAQPLEPVYRQTGLSHHLALFLQTREWQHTDFGRDNEFQHPSDVPGFHILARAIAGGDLTEWNNQDPVTFNTDWRPWEAIRIAERAERRRRAEGWARASVRQVHLASALRAPEMPVGEAKDEGQP